MGISYGSPSSRLPCFLNGDFGWDPVLYTIERPESTSPVVSQCVVPEAGCVLGPYTPRVSAKKLTGPIHTFVLLQKFFGLLDYWSTRVRTCTNALTNAGSQS